MRAVVQTWPGRLELNYMWLPTFVGLNGRMKTDLEEKLGPELLNKEMTDEVLDFAHDRVVEYLIEKFPVPGLRDYLDALKFVQER